MKINGKKIALKIYKDIKKDLKKITHLPGLGVILVGFNKASKIYVSLKEKKASELKIKFIKAVFKNNATEKEILAKINEFNKRADINGILIQTPLPKFLNANKIIKKIAPQKDVDGFLKNSPVVSPPVLATIESLKATAVTLKNKKTALLVNSKIFGSALKNNLKKFLGVSSKVFLPKKENWSYIKEADIIICARGKPHFLKENQIKKGVILVDIGITRVGKKVFGDIAPEALKKSSFYTPVPGGIGPLTIAFLFKNLIFLTKMQGSRSHI